MDSPGEGAIHSVTFQSSIRLLAVEKLTPILKSFLESVTNEIRINRFQKAILNLIIRKTEGVFLKFLIVPFDCQITSLVHQRDRTLGDIL